MKYALLFLALLTISSCEQFKHTKAGEKTFLSRNENNPMKLSGTTPQNRYDMPIMILIDLFACLSIVACIQGILYLSRQGNARMVLEKLRFMKSKARRSRLPAWL
jgi:hypothetical protein